MVLSEEKSNKNFTTANPGSVGNDRKRHSIESDRFKVREEPFKICSASLSDLPQLLELERQCWTVALQATEVAIIGRIRRYELGQLVLKLESGDVVGVIYSQIIQNEESVCNSNYRNVENLHDADGSIIQILALNVLPKYQFQGYGDRLLSFFLHTCKVTGYKRVIGVTRCSRYFRHAKNLDVKQYIHSRSSDGQLLDPILNFHEKNGATVSRLIPGYRQEDIENLGCGVLVTYNLDSPVEKVAKKSIGFEKLVTRDDVLHAIRDHAPTDTLDPAASFAESGFDSADLLKLSTSLSLLTGKRVQPTVFFEFPTPSALSIHLSEHNKESLEQDLVFSPPNQKFDDNAIAVVGMSCRMPGGANSAEDFWKLLISSDDPITDIPTRDRFQADQFLELTNKCGGFLEEVDMFDSHFFNISPAEAKYMDPQQRLLLEAHWRALENAGIPPESIYHSDTAVFVGISSHDYETIAGGSETGIHLATGGVPAAAAGRISYFFGLNGPATVIDTACSSSLVAVHYAAQSLRTGECSVAFASGVNLILHPGTSINYSKAGMLSPSGRCHAFEKIADGYVRSEGVGVVILKRQEDAERDGDTILALIRNSAVAQSEDRNGLTAPSVQSQYKLYEKTFKTPSARLRVKDVDFIQAHGTGTKLGDWVEWESLFRFYGESREDSKPLLVGSIKTNIGHTEAASGISSLISVVLALQHGAIPPNLKFTKLNPEFETNSKQMTVVKELIPWTQHPTKPRLAGVSSFGFTGTISHLLLEEAPKKSKGLKKEKLAPTSL